MLTDCRYFGITVMLDDQDCLRRKNEELVLAYKDKSRKLMQTQELYDKVKRRVELGHMQIAASDAVDSTVHSAATYRSEGGQHELSTGLQSSNMIYGPSDASAMFHRAQHGPRRNNEPSFLGKQ